MNARISVGGREVAVDLSRPISLAIELDFSERQPRHFGAPLASSRPFAVPGFSGSVEHGASCNCNAITLIPHCNGTHTECVGHLTREPLDAHRVAPMGLLPALLVSVEPVTAESADETTEPRPQTGDSLITRRALEKSWAAAAALHYSTASRTDSATSRGDSVASRARSASLAGTAPSAYPSPVRAPAPIEPRALIIRTLPNPTAKRQRDYSGTTPPYLTREAAELLIERGIEHLVVDLPSIDRSHDEGHLTAHRIFFGLPRASVALAQASRPRATITELAFISDDAADGAYLLELQVPALGGDAVPSRPLLYPLLAG